MPESIIKISNNGIENVIIEDDGTEHNYSSSVDKKFDKIKSIAEQLIQDGFNIEKYFEEQFNKNQEWYSKRKKELTEEQYIRECESFCSICNNPVSTFDFLDTLYGVCFKCRIYDWIEHGYLSEDTDEQQAIHLLALENCRKGEIKISPNE